MLQEYNYEKTNCCKKDKKCCIDIIIFILSIILAFTIGLIVGAALVGIVILSLPAIIVFAVVIAILIIIRAIMLICSNNKKC